MLGTITSVITLLNSGVKLVKDTMDVITSLKPKAPTKSAELITNNIYYTKEQEVYNTAFNKQQIIQPNREIVRSIVPLQQNLYQDLLITQPIITPARLRETMVQNPAELLWGIEEFSVWQKRKQLQDDLTLLPVVFPFSGSEYIGWIKKGYAKDYLSLEYKPITETQVSDDLLDTRRSIRVLSHTIRLGKFPKLVISCEIRNWQIPCYVNCEIRGCSPGIFMLVEDSYVFQFEREIEEGFNQLNENATFKMNVYSLGLFVKGELLFSSSEVKIFQRK